MRYFTAILYDRQGIEIDRCPDCEGIKAAKERARYMLSDEYPRQCETTHSTWGTMKAAIFADGAPTGANRSCEWDKEHPQHAAWVKAEDKREQEREAAEVARLDALEAADEHTESERAEFMAKHGGQP